MIRRELDLLVVDDDDVFRERLLRAFGARGLEAAGARDHAQALAVADARRPERAVVDLRMPGKGGLDVLRDLRELDAGLKVVVLTGYGSIATAMEAVRLGAIHYLQKPADADEILAAFQRDGRDPEEAPAAPESVPSLERVEWEHIQRVLTDCSGNISQAARVLGIHRRTLQRKLANRPPHR